MDEHLSNLLADNSHLADHLTSSFSRQINDSFAPRMVRLILSQSPNLPDDAPLSGFAGEYGFNFKSAIVGRTSLFPSLTD
jgi:hypothetical protein